MSTKTKKFMLECLTQQQISVSTRTYCYLTKGELDALYVKYKDEYDFEGYEEHDYNECAHDFMNAAISDGLVSYDIPDFANGDVIEDDGIVEGTTELLQGRWNAETKEEV